MQPIYNSHDRYPMSDKYIRVEHWEDPGLYELSIFESNAASGMADRKLASVHMIRSDMRNLQTALEEYLDSTEYRAVMEGEE